MYPFLGFYDHGMGAWWFANASVARYTASTPEEVREAHRRLGEWWTRKRYLARFDRCCHGKKP